MVSGVTKCKHCRKRIVLVNFAMGQSWRHQPIGSAFSDNMHEFCEITVAEPEEG